MAPPESAAAEASLATDSSAPSKVQLVQNWVSYLFTKEYERIGGDNTREKVKEIQMKKLKGYLAICTFGLGLMHWGGADKVLEDMGKSGKDFTNKFVLFLTAGYFSGLVGIASGTLPDNALWPLFFGGLGAWLSFIFALAVFHLETRKHYLTPEHATYSFYIYFVLFSLSWSHTAQDPLPLHTAGKLLLSTIRGIFYFIRWMWRSKGTVGRCCLSVLCCRKSPHNILPDHDLKRDA